MAREPWVPRPLRRPLAPLRRALDWLLYRLPLQWLVARSERSFARQPEPPRDALPQPLHWAPGISLIVPERGGGELLAQCLAAAHAALAEIDEPVEVIVVVNGSPRADYAALETRFPAVQWLWFDAPLGFTRAVLAGVARARFDAIYLLNNDMRLEPGALRSLLPWRGPAVFALASQILFPDDGRRREETGWTFMPQAEGLPAPWHAESRHGVVRGPVWAGAGSALYHAGLLRELLPGSLPSDPFYWEEVPAYPWLIEDELNTSRTADKIKVLKMLGTPYPDGYEAIAVEDLKKQAAQIAKSMKTDGAGADDDKLETREIVALVAYLQRLGTDILPPKAATAAPSGN